MPHSVEFDLGLYCSQKSIYGTLDVNKFNVNSSCYNCGSVPVALI